MNNPAIQAIMDRREKDEAARSSADFEASKMDHLLSHLALFIDHLVGELQDSTLKVRQVNVPGTQKVEGKVTDTRTDEVLASLSALKKAMEEMKAVFPDVQKISGSVTVENQVQLKDLKIPAPHKRVQADIESMPKYVREGLEGIKKAVSDLKLDPKIELSPTPPAAVSIDFTSLERQLDELLALTRLDAAREYPEFNFDPTPLLEALAAVEDKIGSIKFPIPNFQSSWQHSRYMQSLDAPTAYHYVSHSPSGRKVTDYVEVTLGDGTYRQTFTFDTEGDVLSKTNWVKQ